MSAITHAPPSHYPATVTPDAEPDYVHDALASLSKKQDRAVTARREAKESVDARDEALQKLWAVIGHMGPRAIARATGIGESTIRAKTSHLPKPKKPKPNGDAR